MATQNLDLKPERPPVQQNEIMITICVYYSSPQHDILFANHNDQSGKIN